MSTSSKLRNLKEFLSSTISLSSPQSPFQINSNLATDTTTQKVDNNYKGAGNYKKNSKNSISLFNLMSATTRESKRVEGSRSGRPFSAAFDDLEPYGYSSPPNKSISMYGLGPSEELPPEDVVFTKHGNSRTGYHPSRNLASRLFYNIRSKFRKRRRDRNKIVDSKSTDFGSFLGGPLKNPIMRSSESGEDDISHSSSARYPLKSSRSVDNVLDTLLGSRRLRSFNEEQPNNRLVITHHPIIDNLEDGFMEGDNYASDNVFEEPESPNPNASVTSNTGNSNSNGRIVSTSAIAVSATAPVGGSPSKPLKRLTKELEDLLHYGWYWAGLSKDESEAKLKGQPDGTFVVRDSSSDHYLLSLSFNCNGRTLHTRIEYRNGQFSFYSSDADSFPTVAELINHCMAFSEQGVFCYSRARRPTSPSYAVRLTKPISRFTELKSLLYLSRFVIRQSVRLDLIPQLPLPQSLIEFVSEQRYI